MTEADNPQPNTGMQLAAQTELNSLMIHIKMQGAIDAMLEEIVEFQATLDGQVPVLIKTTNSHTLHRLGNLTSLYRDFSTADAARRDSMRGPAPTVHLQRPAAKYDGP